MMNLWPHRRFPPRQKMLQEFSFKLEFGTFKTEIFMLANQQNRPVANMDLLLALVQALALVRVFLPDFMSRIVLDL